MNGLVHRYIYFWILNVWFDDNVILLFKARIRTSSKKLLEFLLKDIKNIFKYLLNQQLHDYKYPWNFSILRMPEHLSPAEIVTLIIFSSFSSNTQRKTRTFWCCVPLLTSTCPNSWTTTYPCSMVSPRICSQGSSFRSLTTRSWMRLYRRTVPRWTYSAPTSSWRRFSRYR